MRIAIVAAFLSVTTSLAWSATGVADIHGTSEASKVTGTVHFTDTAAGLQVKAQINNATPGAHGFHIHEFGGCGDLGKAAGGHYNPKGTPHGMIMKDGMDKAHAGDMGNIVADAKGDATLDVTIPGITLASSAYTVAGRAVILHEKTDDFGQPVGNAGGRVGCGVITITGN